MTREKFLKRRHHSGRGVKGGLENREEPWGQGDPLMVRDKGALGSLIGEEATD